MTVEFSSAFEALWGPSDTISYEIELASMCPTGRYLAVFEAGSASLAVWQIDWTFFEVGDFFVLSEAESPIWTSPRTTPVKSWRRQIHWSGNSRYVACLGVFDQFVPTLDVWDVQCRKRLISLPMPEYSVESAEMPPLVYFSPVHEAVLFYTLGNGILNIIDLINGAKQSLVFHDGHASPAFRVTGMCINSNATCLMVATSTGIHVLEPIVSNYERLWSHRPIQVPLDSAGSTSPVNGLALNYNSQCGGMAMILDSSTVMVVDSTESVPVCVVGRLIVLPLIAYRESN